jgi:heme exporter protein A
MIRVRNLVKSFGDRPALRGIDLDVAEGERLALVGPNGAGKTTLLRILAALSQPSQGSVRLAGVDLGDGAHAIRRQVGFLSHQPLLYADLSAEENLRFYGRMYDVPDLEQRIATMLRQVGLASSRGDLVRTFSRGMRQRLAIARALLHDPPVLLLDEPFTGLDRQAAQMLDAVLKDASAGARTVVMTTHDLERGWQIGDRMAMLIAGRIAYQMGGKDRNLDAFRREYERQTASGGR